MLLSLARWLDTQSWSTQLHESYYMYAWIESTHVLTLMLFLGMLFVIDLRMLGVAFPNVPASTLLHRLNRPMVLNSFTQQGNSLRYNRPPILDDTAVAAHRHARDCQFFDRVWVRSVVHQNVE